jgi:hypothetical protein
LLSSKKRWSKPASPTSRSFLRPSLLATSSPKVGCVILRVHAGSAATAIEVQRPTKETRDRLPVANAPSKETSEIDGPKSLSPTVASSPITLVTSPVSSSMLA